MTSLRPDALAAPECVPVEMSDAGRPAPLRLDGQQRALHDALLAKDNEMAGMYRGALVVLADNGNDDRLALAAHGLREVMEKLPRYLNVPMPAHQEHLKEKVVSLEERWETTLRNTKCEHKQRWNGEIDAQISKMLDSLGEFFKWFDMHYPRRKAEVVATLRQLDGSGRVLPAPLEKRNADDWTEIRDYFVSVAHHRKTTTQDDFSAWLDALERFLLDRLRPRTFDDLVGIDKIIEEGEGNA